MSSSTILLSALFMVILGVAQHFLENQAAELIMLVAQLILGGYIALEYASVLFQRFRGNAGTTASQVTTFKDAHNEQSDQPN